MRLAIQTEIKEKAETPTEGLEEKVSVRHLNFYYGEYRALADNNVNLYKNKVTAFIGPSGCGKSTLLRILNRIYDLYPNQRADGEVLLDGENILSPKQDLNLLRAKVGMVFQKPTPFPMTIYENIAFGVRLYEQLSKADLDVRVEDSLRRGALWDEVKDKLDANGLSLSGGQQQRLCIARTVAIRPEVILLDEPCSALDPISTAKIEEQVIVMIARRQPLAYDLRQIMAALRISTDLERIGDLGKNIAKRALAVVGEQQPKQLMLGLKHMGELALGQLKEVLDAYIERDADRALKVWYTDEDIDAMYNSLFRELLTYMMEDPRNIGLCTHLLFGAKNIERIGDHATNIAETVYFLVHGKAITDQRPKSDNTSSTPVTLRSAV